jgi:hypothetical protein
MHSYWSSLVGETSPGLTLALVAFLAATPPYRVLCQSARGRARSAIGYLLGLVTGIAATLALAFALRAHADAEAILVTGLLASFFGPFVGMLRAKWSGKRRPVKSRQAVHGAAR